MELDYQTLALIGFGVVILVLLGILFWRNRPTAATVQKPEQEVANPAAHHAITALADVSHHLADLLHKSSPTGTTSPQKEVGKPE